MMYQQAIARRYAKGLMLSANGEDLSRLESELKEISESLLDNKSDLYRLFEDPYFSVLQKKAVINSIAKKADLSGTMHRFLALLLVKDRILLLPEIYEQLKHFIDEKFNRVRATIESATELTDDQLLEIENALKKICQKNVVVKKDIQKDLLGGIRVKVAGLIFDGTVTSKLNALKNKLKMEAYN